MGKHDLGWRHMKEMEAKKELKAELVKDIKILLVIISIISAFFSGLYLGTFRDVNQRRHGDFLIKKAPDNGFMFLPLPKSGEIEKKEKIKI